MCCTYRVSTTANALAADTYIVVVEPSKPVTSPVFVVDAVGSRPELIRSEMGIVAEPTMASPELYTVVVLVVLSESSTMTSTVPIHHADQLWRLAKGKEAAYQL